MQPQLVPSALIHHTAEDLLGRRSRVRRATYHVTIVGALAAIVALPLVHVAVSVQSLGTIRPEVERQSIRARGAGYIQSVRTQRGATVRAGDTLVALEHPDFDAKFALVKQQLAEKRRRLVDLEQLASLADTTVSPPSLVTPALRKQLVKFIAEGERHRIDAERVASDLTRLRVLTQRAFVSPQDMEAKSRDAEVLRADWRIAREETIGQWEASLASERDAIQDLESQRAQLLAERSRYYVIAPIDGSVDDMMSLSPGSFMQGADELLVISPNTRAVAEMQVSTKDIGLLRTGMPVRLMVDAFDYNSWGVVTGTVSSVPRDYTIIDGKPIFRVRCTLEQTELRLKNGVVGQLTKGLTLRGRFLVADRTLLQLLYQRADQWLNPLRTAID